MTGEPRIPHLAGTANSTERTSRSDIFGSASTGWVPRKLSPVSAEASSHLELAADLEHWSKAPDKFVGLYSLEDDIRDSEGIIQRAQSHAAALFEEAMKTTQAMERGRDNSQGYAIRLLFSAQYMRERAFLPRAFDELKPAIIEPMASELYRSSGRILSQLCQEHDKIMDLPYSLQGKSQDVCSRFIRGAIGEAVFLGLMARNEPGRDSVALPASIEDDLLNATDAYIINVNPTKANHPIVPVQVKTNLPEAGKFDATNTPENGIGIAISELGYDLFELADEIVREESDGNYNSPWLAYAQVRLRTLIDERSVALYTEQHNGHISLAEKRDKAA